MHKNKLPINDMHEITLSSNIFQYTPIALLMTYKTPTSNISNIIKKPYESFKKHKLPPPMLNLVLIRISFINYVS